MGFRRSLIQTYRIPLLVGIVVAVAVSLPVAGADAPVACSQLAALAVDGLAVTAAGEVEASGSVPAHCKVAGTLDGSIRFELLLPVAWKGRFVMGGGGGFVGSVQNAAQSPLLPGGTALERGYATVGTDTGHSGLVIDASWALDAPQRELDFAHRAVHRTAEVAKVLIRRHYGKDIAYSYFFGCSRGGGQAMMESQRYPGDFDGIVAGAPAYDWPGLGAASLRTQQVMYPVSDDPSAGPVITKELRAWLEQQILEACDGTDGVEDGLLEDPRSCTFDYRKMPHCENDEAAAGCVTARQLTALEVIYGGLRVGDRQIYPGCPFGGENVAGGWDRWITGGKDAIAPGIPDLHYAFGTQMYKYLIFDDPDWDYRAYDFASWEVDTKAAAALLNATSTDLREFAGAGGKLILWHGWSDAGISALSTIQYYDALEDVDPKARDYSRLFLLPGVLHCAGGPGPDRVDWLGAVASWVEGGNPPDRLQVTKAASGGEPELSRPLCPYPQVARYEGSGDPRQASSFRCGAR